jgi:hypothetical protein
MLARAHRAHHDEQSTAKQVGDDVETDGTRFHHQQAPKQSNHRINMSFSDVGKGGPKRPNRTQLSTQPTIPESQEESLSDGLRQLSDGILQYQAGQREREQRVVWI